MTNSRVLSLEPFHWVMEWKDIITQQHFISLLEKHFFPRWIQVCVVSLDSWSMMFPIALSSVSICFCSELLFCFSWQVLRGWLSVSPNYDEVIQWWVTSWLSCTILTDFCGLFYVFVGFLIRVYQLPHRKLINFEFKFWLTKHTH